MEYNFSDKIQSVKPSAIKEILKASKKSEFISFVAANPAQEAFPIDEIERICQWVLTENPITALQYSVSEGTKHLNYAIKDYVTAREQNLIKDSDEILVVSGAQQGIDLSAKVLLNEGDYVLTEDPSYIGALNTFRLYNTKILGIPMQQDGVDLDIMENYLKTHKNIKIFYTVPNFQNPTGYTTSYEKRKAIYNLCQKYGIVIIEDNPYGELRFEGEHIPSIKSLDTDGLVIYVGSFSKIIAPGIRVGYVIANKNITQKIGVAKEFSDIHTNVLGQIICEKFLTTCNINLHIAKLQRLYKNKITAMENAIAKFDENNFLSYVKPQGGLFLWCKIPNHIDISEFCKECFNKSIAIVPGFAFQTDEKAECHHIRLNFSTPTNEEIQQGIEKMFKKIEL